MLGIAERCGLGINSMSLLADIGGMKYAQPFGVGGHESVLDPVVYHLNEVAGPVRTQLETPLLGCPFGLLASRRARDVASSWRQRREDRIEIINHVRFAADHHAVASLQSPHTAARANVDVVDALRRQFFRAANVVDVIGIPAVNEDVSFV